MNKILSGLIITGLAMLGCLSTAFAQPMAINHFVLKDNPFGTNEVAVVATDTAGNTLENITGDFLFVINGFEASLKFDKGVAFYHHKLLKSSFIYLKHDNDSGTHSTLFYVYKSDTKLIPIHISWILLFAIPFMLVVFGYLFKRFIIIAIILLCIFIYFNHSNGLSIPAFFETVFNGLKHIFTQ